MSIIDRIKGKEKKKGPFHAERILDTDQVKVDQVFTEDGKPVALLTSIGEEQAKKINAEGYGGPTSFGGKGEYEAQRRWVTKQLVWIENLGGAIPLDRAYNSIREAVKAGPGTLLPEHLSHQNVAHVNSIPISDSAELSVQENGVAEIKGVFTIDSSKRVSKEEKE